MLAHIVADHLGVRRRGSSPQTPGDAVGPGRPTTPACCWPPAAPSCLVMVVVTSVKAARRRLRYESWHLLHLYAYLGVGLALPHQLWTGQEFLSSPGRTVFWWTAWARGRRRGPGLAGRRCRCGATCGTGSGHLGRPRGRRRRVGLRDRPAPATGCRCEAGQFFTWRFLGRPGWTRANPYSLSAAPDGRSLRITVQAVGDGSAAASRLRPGHPGAGRGAVRPAQRPGPHPAEGRADRRRRRHHAAAGAGRGARLRARRRGAAAALHRPSRCSPRELDGARPASAACRCSACPGTGAATAPGSATASAAGRRPDGPALLGARHRRARRLRLRPRAVDRPASARTLTRRRPARRPAPPRDFGW